MSETPNGLRGEMAAACFDPGAYVGPRGARTTDQWRADACIAGPLAPFLAQVSALQAEVERLQKGLNLAADEATSHRNAAVAALRERDAVLERLQKVEGEREKDAERVPCGSGSRPSDQAPAGLAPSGFDPSRIVFPAPTESQAKGGWQINVDYLAELSESAERIWPAYYELEATEALLRSIDFSKLVAPCDRSGEAGETSGLDPQGESTVTGAARQAPSDNPLTETKEGSEHV